MTSRIFALIIDPATIDPDDAVTAIHTDLISLQTLVGGFIEAVYGYRTPGGVEDEQPRITFYLNEYGKVDQLPLNYVATALWWYYHPAAAGADTLRGPVVITGYHDDNVPEDVLDTYTALRHQHRAHHRS
jgi:hypothetical protein